MELFRRQDETVRLAGTPAYMSPEQAGGKHLTPASDWYSVGVSLYQALTARLPFEGRMLDLLRRKQTEQPEPPSAWATGIPSDLEDLCMDLLRHLPASRPSGSDILRRLGETERVVRALSTVPSGRPELVGRDACLNQLQEAFDTAAGKAVSVHVKGSSGIGKTALVHAFLSDLRAHSDALILSCRCYEREWLPFKAFDGIVDNLSSFLAGRPHAEVTALLPRDIAPLARMFPVLRRVDAVAGRVLTAREIPDPQTARGRAFQALRGLLANICKQHRLVLFIDDLQWADQDSIVLLEELFSPPDPPPVLLIAALRSQNAGQGSAARNLMESTPGTAAIEISVDRLAEADAERLASSLLGVDSSSISQFIRTILREAQGNPFLIEQLVRWVGPALSGTVDTFSLSDLLEKQLCALPPAARSVAEIVAIAGRPTLTSVAVHAAGVESEPQAIVSVLRYAGLVAGSGSGQVLELRHDRLRETLASRLALEHIQDLHLRLAESLQTLGTDDPEPLFHHYLSAGHTERARDLACRAGDRSAAALAFDQAADFYRSALDLKGSPNDRLAATRSLAVALANAGRPLESGQTFVQAAEQASASEALDFRRRAAEQFLLGGHVDEGLEILRGILAAVGLSIAAGPRSALAGLLLRRLQLWLRGVGFRERSAADIDPELLFVVDLCWAIAAGLSMVDNIRGADFQTRHLLLALRAGEPYRIARALAVEAGFSATPGRSGRNRSIKFSRMAQELAERVGNPHAVGLAQMTAGVSAFLFGEWKRAASLCASAEEILMEQCTGVLWEVTSARNFLLGSLLYLGEVREIRRRLPPFLATSTERGNLYAATEIQTRLNVTWLFADDPAGAREHLDEAMKNWSHSGFFRQHYNALLARAQLALYTGDARSAWDTVTLNWSNLRKTMLLSIQVLRVEALCLKGRCALALAAHDSSVANSRIAEAERLARAVFREQMPWSNPLGELLLAGVAAQRGDRREAEAALRGAASAFESKDMHLHRAVTLHVLAELLTGSERAALLDSTNDWFAGEGIKNPGKVARMLAPGILSP
jgi:Cdc6-like AAA superfamily ATPase